MPGIRKGATARERILRSACEEFTRRGFAGARVDAIATRAKASKALVYHHFRNKASLYSSVLECKMEELASIDVDPARAAEIAGDLFDFHAANRELTRLMMWEALDFGTRKVPNEAARAKRFAGHVETVARAQQAAGITGLDPGHLLVSVLGIVSYWFAFPQAARLICGGDPYTREALRRRRAHVVETVRRILEGRS